MHIHEARFMSRVQTKCECYLPESVGVYGAVHVTVDSQLELDGLIVRHLTLKASCITGTVFTFYCYLTVLNWKVFTVICAVLRSVFHTQFMKCLSFTEGNESEAVLGTRPSSGRNSNSPIGSPTSVSWLVFPFTFPVSLSPFASFTPRSCEMKL